MFYYFLAIVSAFFYASSYVFIRKGLQSSTTLTALFFAILFQGICFWILGLIMLPLDSLRWSIIWPFVVAGLFVPALSRYFSYLGIEKLGVAINGSVLNVSPFFTLLSGALFLRENLNFSIFLGTLFIVAGLTLISFKKEGVSSWKKRHLLFPITGAFIFGSCPSLIKYGLNKASNPILAATVQITVSIILISIFFLRVECKRSISIRKESLIFFMGAGFCTFLAFLSYNTALLKGKVTTIIPLCDSTGLFSILLSSVFLRNQEKITWAVLGGGILIFLGSSLLIYFNPIN